MITVINLKVKDLKQWTEINVVGRAWHGGSIKLISYRETKWFFISSEILLWQKYQYSY